jgi:glycosyltransferase involved in cell wall biosynthesis
VSAPAVSIVIAAKDAARTLGGALSACGQQDFAQPLEIVVVDDGSADDTARIARRAGARVVSQENRGPAAARNRGWREARAPVVLFTDADCVPRPDWVRKLAGGLDAEHAVVCGSYGIANRGRWLAETVHAEIVWRHSRLPDDVEFAGSYNFAARRDALEAVGGFDESYPAPSGEDNDLSYRLRDAGYTIRFVRDALVDHHHPERLSTYLREQARHGYWRAVLYARHPNRMRGDGYAGPADLAAPPLAALSVVCALGAPFWLPAAAGAPLCLALVIAVHHFLALRVSRHCRQPAALALAAVGTLRAYARAWGMVMGGAHVLLRRER